MSSASPLHKSAIATVAGVFLRPRTCWLPTWKGWTGIGILALLFAFLFVLRAYPFLSPNDPLLGGALVVEGWVDDETMLRAIDEMRANHYAKLFVTGTAIADGVPFSEFHSLAELGASSIRALSEGTVEPQAVPASDVRKDRTFASARALKSWMQAHGGIAPRITVLSIGPHARRTRLLFSKAFGGTARIGIIAAAPANYDPNRWWQSAEGFRAVLAEFVAYLYARFLFRG